MLTGTAGVALAPKPLTATVKALESFEVVEPNTAGTWFPLLCGIAAIGLTDPDTMGLILSVSHCLWRDSDF